MPTTALAPRPSALGRAAAWMMRRFRLADAVEQPTEHVAGSDFAAGFPSDPGYSARRAMSAYPANPWLSACVLAIATDLSGLPLEALDSTGQTLPDHAILQVFRRPAPGLSGTVLRMQVVADLVLTGNAFLLELYGVRGEVVGLRRLHPARIRIVPAADGTPLAYEYTGDGVQAAVYGPTAVRHVRWISWEDDPRGLYGQGVVRPLDRDLEADTELAKMTARAAAKGRPDAIYRPSKPEVTWNPAQVRSMKGEMSRLMSSSHGGVAILGGAGTLEVLGWSPREMEGVKQREWTRDTILAVTGVPPTRVGLPTANYATAREQMLTYWQGTIKPLAALMDEAFSEVGHHMRQPASVRHDFSAVPALQTARTEALDRVQKHIDNGLSTEAAYAREGLTLDPSELAAPSAPAGVDAETVRGELAAARALLASQPPSTERTAALACLSRAAHLLTPGPRLLAVDDSTAAATVRNLFGDAR